MFEPMLETREAVSASQGRGRESFGRRSPRALREEKPGHAAQGRGCECFAGKNLRVLDTEER